MLNRIIDQVELRILIKHILLARYNQRCVI